MQECKADHVAFDIARSNNRVMRNPRHVSENPESESSAPAADGPAEPVGVTDPFAPARAHAEEPELAGAPF